MKKLLEAMEQNAELKAKIDELDKNPDSAVKDYIELASEYGIEIKEEDFQPASIQGEVSDEELDAVAGGGECYCAVGGGGSESYKDGTCGCVLYGQGSHLTNSSGQGGGMRCTCAVGGYGTER